MLVEYASESILVNLSRLQFSKFLNGTLILTLVLSVLMCLSVVAAVAVFAYDYCLTFSSEVEYVWGTKWEVSRIVFTLSRYLPFISSSLTCYDALVNDRCGSFVLGLDAMYSASVIFAEGILILRTYALWGRSRKILFLLLFLAAAFIAGAEVTSLKFKIILPGDTTSSYQFFPSKCAYGSSRNAAFQYAFLVAYEIILQSMSSWRKFRTYRTLRSRTLNTLYWDGIMYMWWIIVLSGGNMTVMAAAPMAYIPALDTAQVAIHSVLASRIFFNLRECDKEIHFVSDEFSLETLRYRAWSTVGATTQAEVAHAA